MPGLGKSGISRILARSSSADIGRGFLQLGGPHGRAGGADGPQVYPTTGLSAASATARTDAGARWGGGRPAAVRAPRRRVRTSPMTATAAATANVAAIPSLGGLPER